MSCPDPTHDYEDYDMDHHDDTVDPNDCRDDYYDDSMDGDFDSAMRDAGFGTDEDYGLFDSGEDY